MLENIKRAVLSRYELSDDTLLDVIKLDVSNLDSKIADKIVFNLRKLGHTLHDSQTRHLTSNLLNWTLVGGRIVTNVESPVYKYLDSCSKHIKFLLADSEKNILYFPKFLLYYLYPEISSIIEEWKKAEDEGIVEMFDKDPFFDRLFLVKNYPELVDKNLLNSNDVLHSMPHSYKEQIDELKIELQNRSTKILDEIFQEAVTEETQKLYPNGFLFNAKSDNAYTFDYVTLTDEDLDKMYEANKNKDKSVIRYLKNDELTYDTSSGFIQVISSKKKILTGNPLKPLISGTNNTSIIFVPKSVEVISGKGFISSTKLISLVFEPGSNLKHTSRNILDSLVRKLILPSKLETIGNFSFLSQCLYGLSPLKNVIFENNTSLKKIGSFAFYITDSYITSPFTGEDREYYNLPSSLEEIGDFAFATGYDLLNLAGRLDSHLTDKIDDESIKNCYFTAKSRYQGDRIFISSDGNKFEPLLFLGSNVPDLTKCTKLRRIGVGAFRRTTMSVGSGNDYILRIPPSVEEIGDFAFANNPLIKTVIFEKGSKLKYLGEKAFFNCKSLSSVIFESPVELDRIRYMTFAFTSITKFDLENLPKLKVIESCAVINTMFLKPDFYTAYPLNSSAFVHWLHKPERCVILNNLHVREKFIIDRFTLKQEPDGETKVHDTIILKAPTIEEYINTIENKDYTTSYDTEFITRIDYGFNTAKYGKDVCIVEDLLILRYLEYLISAKKCPIPIKEKDVIQSSSRKYNKYFINKFIKKFTKRWRS